MPTSHLHEIRHMRSGSLNNAPPPSGHPNAINMGGVPMPGPGGVGINHGMRFDQPRSPPNTSHVPCKFFKQGACQAGNTCPFNHDLSHASETVCKYFAKGNCKFGPKCANIHMLPDGRRINYGKSGVSIGGPPIAGIGNRINPATYGHTSTNSALTSSFMRNDNVPPYTAASPYPIPSDNDHRYMHHHHLGRQPSLDNGLVPTIDTTHTSDPTSAYGSPRDDELNNGNGGAARLGLGMSPVAVPRQGLSVLDATLPASFDSNGISHAARYGPWPASVPNKFGLDSPSHSLGAAKDGRTSETLKMLHDSAFGGSAFLAEHRQHQAGGERENNGGFGSSPPVGSGPGIGIGSASNARMMPYASNHNVGMGSLQSELESYVSSPRRGGGGEAGTGAYRISHSQAYRRPRMLSASAPKQIDNSLLQQQQHDSDTDFQFEEEYIPGELANEVLTPHEKARRGSSTYTVRNLSYGPDHDDLLPSPSARGGISIGGGRASASSAMNTPGMSTSKFGSPSPHSPSPWGSAVFNNRPKEEDRDFSPDLNGNSLSRSLKHASAFGHVGSPLRNSSLASAMGAEIMNNNNNNNNNSSGNSPPANLTSNQNRSGETLSALTQQFRQTSLDNNDSPHLHPLTAAARNGAIGQQHRNMERHVSSGSIGSSGRFTTPIHENEDENFVFNMEDETTGGGGNHPLPPAAAQQQQQQQHNVFSSASAGGPLNSGGWSYASAVAASGKGGGAIGSVGSIGNVAGVGAVGNSAPRGNGNGNSTAGTVGGR
ncbi:hypothetical protein GE09DRAFT_361741 [Coniochaeta sp. 2T2.1]|nr:hypothetical protein GE09DRAFT_361741 [Coniochaeta sp. 2T2.1]